MKKIKELPDDYFLVLAERRKKSRASEPHQFLGLIIARLLDDANHKSLYIKLAKEHDAQKVWRLAKSVAEKKNVKNKGAYFMKVFFDGKKIDGLHRKK